VVDASELRRGRETANALFGNEASVLVGDFLYSRAFEMMVEIGSMRVMEILSHTTNTIAEGEVLQLLNCHDAGHHEDRYMEVIRSKTAKLFEAAARIGAVLGGQPDPRSRPWPTTACTWAPPSSSSMTCWTTAPRPRRWARTWATTWPRASPPCR
jgi:octaprenyl-diphosphate synthase